MLHSSLQEGSSACNFKIMQYINLNTKENRTSYRNKFHDGQNIWLGFSTLQKLYGNWYKCRPDNSPGFAMSKRKIKLEVDVVFLSELL